MSTLHAALAQVGSAFAENLRVRWGVWGILGIVAVHGLLVQFDRLKAVRDDHAVEAARLARAETLRGGEDWMQLLAAEREAGRALEGAFWQAETEGVAQAQLHSALTDIVDGLDLRRPSIHSGVSQEVPGVAGVWQVQTRLICYYRPGAELQMVYRLATYPKKLVVERLNIWRETSRMTLIVSAYFVGIEPAQDLQGQPASRDVWEPSEPAPGSSV